MPPSTSATAAPVAAPLRPAPPSPDDALLALDLGTTTGWALRAANGLITSGTVSFRPGRYDGGGMRYLPPPEHGEVRDSQHRDQHCAADHGLSPL